MPVAEIARAWGHMRIIAYFAGRLGIPVAAAGKRQEALATATEKNCCKEEYGTIGA
ncbi:MAG: hypothetical protein OXU61_12920 [Gammaproteobacteria bacterium]|nr:hypothetical protein [Gammaproteobacteria bacterium]